MLSPLIIELKLELFDPLAEFFLLLLEIILMRRGHLLNGIQFLTLRTFCLSFLEIQFLDRCLFLKSYLLKLLL